MSAQTCPLLRTALLARLSNCNKWNVFNTPYTGVNLGHLSLPISAAPGLLPPPTRSANAKDHCRDTLSPEPQRTHCRVSKLYLGHAITPLGLAHRNS